MTETMSKTNLRIGFLLGSPDINGGTYVIYEHGSRLVDRGCQVFMLTREKIAAERFSWHPGAAKLGWLTMSEAEAHTFDLVFATYWQSPFLLSRLHSSHCAYFVQSIESRFFEEPDPAHHDKRLLAIWKSYCESTYSLNVPVITEARWIQNYLYERYNRDSFLVRNGIRKDIYRPEGAAHAPRTSGRLRVLVEGPVEVFYKNVPKSVALCRQAGVDEIWLLTSSAIDSFPDVDRVFSRIPIDETPHIYRSCDVLVKLSHVEGMFGPPLEMFHCGGTAIVYDVTGHDEYMVHNENSYVVTRDDDRQVVGYLENLRQDEAELNRLKRGALLTAGQWPDWQQASGEFADAVQQIIRSKPISHTYLRDWSLMHHADRDKALYLKEVERFIEREEATGRSEYERHNFVQIYHKAEGEDLDPERELWFHYQSDEPAVITARLSITGLPFWIRVDPSVRIGMVIIDSITVVQGKTGKVLIDLREPESFNDVLLGGTIRRIGWQSQAAFLCYGTDPWFYLPQITEGEVGDEIELRIHLREIGMTQFANRYTLESAGSVSRKGGRLDRLRGILQKK